MFLGSCLLFLTYFINVFLLMLFVFFNRIGFIQFRALISIPCSLHYDLLALFMFLDFQNE